MKKNLLKLVAVFAIVMATACIAHAQTSFICSHRSACIVDDDFNLSNCTENDENSTFIFDDDFTTITHVLGSKRTVYSIDEDEIEYEEGESITFYTYNKDGDPYVFVVTLDDDVSILMFYEDSKENLWVAVYDVDEIE